MKYIALFDRGCALCQSSKRLSMKFDWLNRVDWMPLQESKNEEWKSLYPLIELRRELHLFDHNQRVWKGFFAIRKLMLQFPLTFLLGLICYIPFMSKIGVPLYSWVAKNRHRFLKKKCENGSCSI